MQEAANRTNALKGTGGASRILKIALNETTSIVTLLNPRLSKKIFNLGEEDRSSLNDYFPHIGNAKTPRPPSTVQTNVLDSFTLTELTEQAYRVCIQRSKRGTGDEAYPPKVLPIYK